MKTIDESRLETDPVYRFGYLKEFIGFGTDDAETVLESGPYLGPLIPQVVEKTYARLLAYDATARHFLPRQSGFTGQQPGTLAELSATHPQIHFRKEHLVHYLMHILGRAFDQTIVPFLDMVGKIHTAGAGNPEIAVPLVQMNAFLGYLADVLTEMITESVMDTDTKLKTIRAFSKLLWIQNDFIHRHYLRAEAARV